MEFIVHCCAQSYTEREHVYNLYVRKYFQGGCVKVYPTVKYHDRVRQAVRHMMQILFPYACLRPLCLISGKSSKWVQSFLMDRA